MSDPRVFFLIHFYLFTSLLLSLGSIQLIPTHMDGLSKLIIVQLAKQKIIYKFYSGEL